MFAGSGTAGAPPNPHHFDARKVGKTVLLGSGDGAFRAPMGTMVIGGLILSTVLTLVIVPAGFSLADGVERRLGPWMRNRFLTYRPGDEDGDSHKGEVAPAE